jgi:hypothetical protein
MSELNFPGHIVLTGVNLDSLFFALHLRHQYPKQKIKLSVIGDMSEGHDVEGMCVINQDLANIIEKLGNMTEAQWMAKTDASYFLRTTFIGWHAHPFSIPVESEIDRFHFPLLEDLGLLVRQGFDVGLRLEDFFFANRLASDNLAPIAEQFPFKNHYQYQVNAAKLLDVLISIATQNNVNHVKETLEAINIDKDGFASAAITQQHKIVGDLFVNFDPRFNHLFKRQAVEQSHQDKIRNNDAWLQLAIENKKGEYCRLPQEIRYTTLKHGYVEQSFLQEHSLVCYRFSSAHQSHEAAIAELNQYLISNELTTESYLQSAYVQSHYPQATNQHVASTAAIKEPWQYNHICLMPILSPAFGVKKVINHYAVQAKQYTCTVRNFVDALIASKSGGNFIDEYNTRMESLYDSSSLFACILYLFNGRQDTPYWKVPQQEQLIPKALVNILERWISGKPMDINDFSDNSLLAFQDTLCLFLGMKMHQNATKPFDNIAGVKQQVEQMNTLLSGCTKNFHPSPS